MKIIEIPATLTVKSIGPDPKPETISFKTWALLHIDLYAEAKTVGQIRQLAKIATALETDGTSFQLEDAEYELLKAATGVPKYVPGVSRQMIPYYDALDKAQDVKK